MKTGRKEDPVDRLFASLRQSEVPDDGFTGRVMNHILPRPSRNSYRIPTLAAAMASVVLLIVVSVKGPDVSRLAVKTIDWGREQIESLTGPDVNFLRLERDVPHQARGL